MKHFLPASFYKSLLLATVLCGAATLFLAFVQPQSGGAPVSSTGAPDEVNCTTSGCHDDTKANIGEAQTQIQIGESEQQYEPGKIYPITVTIADAKSRRFGFQIVALDSDNKNAGNIRVTDATRTQVITNPNYLTDRQYGTYTYPGTEPASNGVGSWTVQWTAPEKNVGKITFYAATVSANDDNTDKGDQVYTTSRSLQPRLAISVKNEDEVYERLSPNPASEIVNIPLGKSSNSISTISVVNVTGKTVSEFTSVGVENATFDASTLLSGKYIVRIVNQEKTRILHFIKN
jgi:hypothetical protein